MDMMSFALGILSVAFIFTVVGVIYSFVKVRMLLKKVEDIHRRIDMDISSTEKSIISYMDSRIDKIVSKIK